MLRPLVAFTLALSLTACGGVEGDFAGATILLASHDSFPPGAASYSVRMRRLGPTVGCGTNLTTFETCLSATGGTVSGLCSGDWVVEVAGTNVFASSDCTGPRLLTTVASSPDPVFVDWNATATVLIVFQAASLLRTDVSSAGNVLIGPLTHSIAIRARRQGPADPGCGTAVSDVADRCFSFTPTTDFPPADLATDACSGAWTLCAVGYEGFACSGNVIEKGLVADVALDYGGAAIGVVDMTATGTDCPF